jgi:hypothetical protein
VKVKIWEHKQERKKKMQFAKRLFMGLGVVAFMAMLFTLAAPKAVHGLVATLVLPQALHHIP